MNIQRPLTEIAGVYTYDFTDDVTKAFGGVAAHKEIVPNVWDIVAADGNADGDVSNPDKNELWGPNSDKGSQVPESVLLAEGYTCQVPK